MDITHSLEKDGTELVSTAQINGRDVLVRLAWDSAEKAQENLEAGKRAAEKHFKIMTITEGDSKNLVRKFTLFNHEVTLGKLKGNNFTAARFSLGKVSYVADLVDGRIDWNTMRKDHRRTVHNGGLVFGFGAASKALFLRIKKKG